MARKPKPLDLEKEVTKVVQAAPKDDLVAALGKLISLRLRRLTQPKPSFAERLYTPVRTEITSVQSAKRRRSARRIGRIKFYEPTSKPDVSRHGTFRRYMISTIRKHTDTRAAELDHADNCDDERWAKNKLDFNWAADNGFINWK